MLFIIKRLVIDDAPTVVLLEIVFIYTMDEFISNEDEMMEGDEITEEDEEDEDEE